MEKPYPSKQKANDKKADAIQEKKGLHALCHVGVNSHGKSRS
jgi:hypothetical protein